VNNEGMISGWHVISVGGGATIDVVARWDRTGKFIRSGAQGGYQERIWVIDMNDRGQILSRVRAGPHYEVRVENADGSGFMMPQTYTREISHDPVRMNRAGDVMATYWLNPDCWYTESCPIEDILTTHLGWLDPPFTPPGGAAGLCVGETIDDNRAVYGLCGGLHYRWTTRDNAAPFPSGPDRLIDVWIHDINRYGELVGRTTAGPIFWSQATGRIQIPMPPGVTPLEPVAINDRGEVLLASDYREGSTQPAQTIAYWTKSSGTVVLPRKGWPIMAAHDINNQGVIVGCVGGDGGKELVPAYWRIR
jgi:hypothetical protein